MDSTTKRDNVTAGTKHENKHLLVFVPENQNLLWATLNYLADYIKIHEMKAIVLRTKRTKDEDGRYVITFKVPTDYKFDNHFFVSVSKDKWYKFRLMQVHSKSEHKVYYTLNALKTLVPDKSASTAVPWEEYKSQVLYTTKGALKAVDTELVGIVNLEPDYASEAEAKTRQISVGGSEE